VSSALSLRELSLRLGEFELGPLSLKLEAGDYLVLLGPSGCGKTSLLRAVAGLEPVAGGSVHIGGREVTSLPPYRRGAPMVFQGYALWPHMTLLENAAYGLEAGGASKAEARSRALESLRMVGLEGRAESRPAELSGGQQQRVALARALAAGPDVVLLDEPLSNLDAKLRREMRGELVRLHRDAGFTAIYVTHDQEEALSMAQRLALMQAGRVIELGAPRELYGAPSTRFGAEFLGEVNWLKVEAVHEGSPGHVSVKTALGEVSVRAPERPAAGYLLGFRPERARVGEASGEALRLHGKVRGVSFLGGEERLTLELPGGQELVLRIEAVGARPGSKLVGYVDARDVWLLPGD